MLQRFKQLTLAVIVAHGFTVASASKPGNDWQPVPVEIQKTATGWQLLRGGEPYFVKGAGGDVYKLDLLKSLGANAIRTWGVGDGSVLDEAHARGMTVLLCLDIAPERLGFDYDDTDACLLYTSPSPRDRTRSRMPSSA